MIRHKGTQALETKRLILRRATLDDAEAMFHNWASDPKVTKYLTWPTHANVAITQAVLQDWVTCYARQDYYQWMIILKEFDTCPIGSISVVSLDDSQATAEIGYCIGQPWWHQGIMSEALAAVIDYLFEQVGILHVKAKHDTNNPYSGAVMRKCGMRYQGIQLQAGTNNQGPCDIATYLIANHKNTQKNHDSGRSKTDNSVQLVRAASKDASIIQQIQREAFSELLKKYEDHETNPANESIEHITWKITQPDSYYYYIMLAENIVGCIRIVDAKNDTPKRISPLYILPQYRGKGYAQAAILKAEEMHGADHWTLETILQEKGNCHLYEKLGYQKTGQATKVNEKMTLIRYEK